MANAFDVAAYILESKGVMSAMKLQKLVYYSQAWSLVWDDEPLFCNKIEAWANGPVVRDLYDKHRGQYQVSKADFQQLALRDLSENQKDTIDQVLDAYSQKSAQWLSDQTHSEAPWLQARNGLTDADRGDREISLASMAEYYSSL
ncbi:MAG: DUF4065 domain-containing protein [Methylophaga sp.]|uniref:Panacea domain-containing protein n=1 Tax=Methylophaga sp. TaxID=2024840 RepID=UPI00299CEC07|nr:type II toxin-antitoxin system antitoxin SocA domain-containing protein [Methylophaga sp.]MDX1751420.1 DUF4065 domain-containing protein [Methylophaga sp.]